jgi:hypothetical protein
MDDEHDNSMDEAEKQRLLEYLVQCANEAEKSPFPGQREMILETFRNLEIMLYGKTQRRN